MPIPVLKKGLDAGMLRDKAIANNVANLNTHGYKRIDVKFESELRDALSRTKLKGLRTQTGHLPVGRKELNEVFPEGYRSKDKTKPGEINNIDIDMEMSKLAENQIQFHFCAKFMKQNLEDISNVIKGRLA